MGDDSRPTPLDFISFLPYACKQLQTSFEINISVCSADEYVSSSEKSRKPHVEKSSIQYTSQTQVSPERLDSPAVWGAGSAGGAGDAVRAACACDGAGRLVELRLHRTNVPRILLKIIGLCVPYQPHLNKLSIRWSSIDCHNIYEISKSLPHSNITEICLDDCPVGRHNCSLLLDCQSCLRSLSLNRCSLESGDCVAIAVKLEYPLPASRSLCILSLASNFIANEGAIALGKMLRSNRKLHHLNLSGNQIDNTGAMALFDSMMLFPMTYDEIIATRLRNIDYLKLQKEVYANCYNELMSNVDKSIEDHGRVRKKPSSSHSKQPPWSSSSRHSVDGVAGKAEAMTLEMIGPYEDPFCDRDTLTKNNYLYSIGNMSLNYLNVSNNNIELPSISKLVEVMRYQGGARAGGLVRVVVDGNPLPRAARELDALRELAAAAHARPAPRVLPAPRARPDKPKPKVQ